MRPLLIASSLLAVTPTPSLSPAASAQGDASWLDPSRLVTSLMVPVLAGLIGALITHLLTSSRAREDWRRDRYYELMSDFTDAHAALYKACEKPQWESRTGYLIWKPLENAIAQYLKATSRIVLLTSNAQLRISCGFLENNIQILVQKIEDGLSLQPENMRDKNDLTPFMQPQLAELQKSFREVRQDVTDKYLNPRRCFHRRQATIAYINESINKRVAERDKRWSGARSYFKDGIFGP